MDLIDAIETVTDPSNVESTVRFLFDRMGRLVSELNQLGRVGGVRHVRWALLAIGAAVSWRLCENRFPASIAQGKCCPGNDH